MMDFPGKEQDKTDLSIIILMAKKIDDLRNGKDADDAELIERMATKISQLADENYILRKDNKGLRIQHEADQHTIIRLETQLSKASKWKKQLNNYREKYEMLRYGYVHGGANIKKAEKGAPNDKQQSGSIDANQEGT